MRTAKSTNEPYVERMFGTMESEVLNGLTGYTGRKAGALPGYDAVEGGVLDVGLLYEIITRYLIDIYPHEPHFGTGMFGRTPHQVMTQLEEGYGSLRPPSLQDRRIQLGWRVEATPNDEGVQAFGLAWESTEKDTAFHLLRDRHPGRWTLCIDPENIRHITVLIPGRPEPVTARLSTTLFADLTLPQYLKVVEELRRQDPTRREFEGHDVSEARRHIEHINATATHSHKLPRSFMTQAECETEARRLTSGISLPSGHAVLATVKPGSVTADEPEGSFLIGDGSTPTAGVAPPPPAPAVPSDPPETGRLPRPDTKGKLT